MFVSENEYPHIRMEDVENADYRTIQKRFDDMLEAIGRADEKKGLSTIWRKPSA